MIETIKKVSGWLDTSAYVDCPYCDCMVDLFEIPKFQEEGMIYGQLFSGEGLGCKDFDEKIECPECRKEFCVGEIVW